jgi:hypothetical protein
MTHPSPLSAQEVRKLYSEYADHARFCSHLTIKDKSGGTVPYIQSPGGKKLTAAIAKQEAAGLPVRIVVLKASQVWMSSSTATEIFRRVPFWPGRRALVLADTQAHADLVFEYYDQYIKSYGDNPIGGDLESAIRLPGLDKDTEQHLRWENGSSILVGTANNIDIARSAPYNWVQLSEAAFYRSLGGVMTGLMQRVPDSPESGVIIESTANGMGGDFYELWQQAASGRTGWLGVFFAWWEHPENVKRPEMLGYKDRAAFQASLSKAEWTQQRQYNLTLDQLAWRRHKIETDCSGHIERFEQEHPANPQEAFIASGRTIFDLGALSRMPVMEPTIGRLEVVQVGLEKRIQFLEDRAGEINIYRKPLQGHKYIIGVDHAEGIDPTAKEGRSDPDYCSATVLDIDTGEQVAKMKARFEPRPWAERVYWLGRWYNWAYLVPEQKAVGKAVIGHLLEIEGGYPLELIYSQERDPSDRRPALLQDLGYDTNTVYRPILVSALDTAIREMSIQIHDAEQLEECRAFVRKPNGREEGMRHDDDVFGVALAVVGLPKARRAFAYREQRAKVNGETWKPMKYGRRGDDDDD